MGVGGGSDAATGFVGSDRLRSRFEGRCLLAGFVDVHTMVG